MKTKPAIAALLLLLALVPAAPAHALSWGLGADLGGSLFKPDYPDAEGVATFAWPSMGPGYGQIAGLRVNFAGSKPEHEVWLGTSFAFRETGGHSTRLIMLSGNYQYNFTNRGGMIPYVTAGAGVDNASNATSTGGTTHSASGAIAGGGAGLSWRVRDGAGRIRTELRYDYQTEGKSLGDVVIEKGSLFALKVGFDLWVK